jgi:aspartyl-tRNA(Asn)/glutamyl-tRNA(Gln) amidotransferase subunit B
LLEIVSEPDLRGAKEAVAYARALHRLVTWIGICDGNMQEGSFRCDANVSVRRAGEKLGTRCEIKNLNSFRFMEHAVEFEARRQIEILESGGKIEQETRLYDPDREETRSMRTKEEAHDYRYFPDPDLLPLVISEEQIEQVRRSMPETIEEKVNSYIAEYSLTPYQAALLTSSRETSTFADATFKGVLAADVPRLANLIIGPLASLLKEEAKQENRGISPDQLRRLGERVADGTVSSSVAASTILPIMWREGQSADEIIEQRGLKQISDAGAIEKLVDEVLAQNAKQVEDYRAGKEKAFNSLVGQVMKATQGKANPAQVNDVLRKKLKP